VGRGVFVISLENLTHKSDPAFSLFLCFVLVAALFSNPVPYNSMLAKATGSRIACLQEAFPSEGETYFSLLISSVESGI
jgi:hypothetical protein